MSVLNMFFFIAYLKSIGSPPSISGATNMSNRGWLVAMLRSNRIRRGRTRSLMPSMVSAMSDGKACTLRNKRTSRTSHTIKANSIEGMKKTRA